MASVCTGSVVFAAAGLLGGRPATSHPRSLDHMKTIDPTIEVRLRRVTSTMATSSPRPASAPGSTWLCPVGRFAGPERARQVREGIDYAPDPPH
jgi:putative intracellular protease/amidase